MNLIKYLVCCLGTALTSTSMLSALSLSSNETTLLMQKSELFEKHEIWNSQLVLSNIEEKLEEWELNEKVELLKNLSFLQEVDDEAKELFENLFLIQENINNKWSTIKKQINKNINEIKKVIINYEPRNFEELFQDSFSLQENINNEIKAINYKKVNYESDLFQDLVFLKENIKDELKTTNKGIKSISKQIKKTIKEINDKSKNIEYLLQNLFGLQKSINKELKITNKLIKNLSDETKTIIDKINYEPEDLLADSFLFQEVNDEKTNLSLTTKTQETEQRNVLITELNFKKIEGTAGLISATTIDQYNNIYVSDTNSSFNHIAKNFVIKVADVNSYYFTKELTGLPNEPKSLIVDKIGNVYVGIEDRFYFDRYSYGLWKCNHDEWEFKFLDKTISIYALEIDNNNNIYFSSTKSFIDQINTIYKYDATNNKFSQVNIEFPEPVKTYFEMNIVTFTTDKNDNLYALSSIGHLYHYQAKTNTFELIKNLKLTKSSIKNMTTDDNGDLYVQSITNIYKITAKTKELIPLKFTEKKDKMADKKTIKHDSKNNIYTTTDDTIFKLNKDTNTFEKFYQEPQINSNFPSRIINIEFDNENNIYKHLIQLNNGIFRSKLS